ncbi:MAG TPA: hypothetical protein VHA13_05470 [Gammaproteobacteria bacterium]|nr:hypothetical protein [Gammaproteobacteria bacterium]
MNNRKDNEEYKEHVQESEHKENISFSTTMAVQSLKSTLNSSTSFNSERISKDVLLIVERLKNDKDFFELDLTNKNFTTNEKKIIFNALAENSTVNKVVLSNVKFNLTDAKNFYDAFEGKNNTSLKSLVLNNNRIDAVTLEWILKTPLSLDKLVLINNDIGDDGLTLIANLAKVKNLGLQQNRVTTKGVDALLNSKNEFTQLTYISLKMGNLFGLYQPLENKITSMENSKETLGPKISLK